MRPSDDQNAARCVGRNSERFRHRTSQATAFGGTALRSALRATVLRPIVLATTCSWIFASASAVAAPEDMPKPRAPELAHVVIFGDWNKGERTGIVRYVQSAAGIEHARSRAWVQWVEFTGEMGYDTKIVASRELDQLKGNFGIFVPTPEFRNGKLILYASHSFEHCTFKLSLIATDIGRVTVTATAEAQSAARSICKVRDNKPFFD